MRLTPRTATRRVAGALVAVAALGSAFTLGVVAGGGSPPPRPADPATGSSDVLDDAADQITAAALHPVDRATLDAAAIRAMLGATGDSWGEWAAPPTASTPGAYVGVGLWLRSSGGALLVSQVRTGSPAGRAGVLAGDELRAVDDRSCKGLAPASVAASLQGTAGSRVVLVVRRGAALRTVQLRREAVPAAGVTESMTTPQVGRIVVPSFTPGTGRQVRDALASVLRRRATGVVLDLRGDPGGLLAEAVETASAFLSAGPVVTYTRRDGQPQSLDAEGRGDTGTPLVVLVDGGTASAAEVVAGALQDRGRAVVVGSRTYGKGSVQEPHRLSDGSSLALTVARYTLPSGRSPEGVGIEPDIEVSASPVPGSDPAVRRALEVLTGLLADAGATG